MANNIDALIMIVNQLIIAYGQWSEFLGLPSMYSAQIYSGGKLHMQSRFLK